MAKDNPFIVFLNKAGMNLEGFVSGQGVNWQTELKKSGLTLSYNVLGDRIREIIKRSHLAWSSDQDYIRQVQCAVTTAETLASQEEIQKKKDALLGAAKWLKDALMEINQSGLKLSDVFVGMSEAPDDKTGIATDHLRLFPLAVGTGQISDEERYVRLENGMWLGRKPDELQQEKMSAAQWKDVLKDYHGFCYKRICEDSGAEHFTCWAVEGRAVSRRHIQALFQQTKWFLRLAAETGPAPASYLPVAKQKGAISSPDLPPWIPLSAKRMEVQHGDLVSLAGKRFLIQVMCS